MSTLDVEGLHVRLRDREELASLVKQHSSDRQILLALGLGDAPNGYHALRTAYEVHGIKGPARRGYKKGRRPPSKRRGKLADDDAVRAAVQVASSRNEALTLLGVASSTPTMYSLLERRCAELGLDVPQRPRRNTSGRKPYPIPATDEKILRVASEAGSLREAVLALGMKYHQRNVEKFKDACFRLGASPPVWKPTTAARRRSARNRSFAETFKQDAHFRLKTGHKAWLIDDGHLTEECADCGIGPEWNGKPLTLQLDHINGDSRDHRVENLQLLCPNCHTQTDTFAGRNLG